jgi:tyrosine-protein phosphatase SIW14
MTKNIFRKYVAVLVALFSFTVFTQAQTSPSAFPNIKVNNFGQMDENYFRGAQPMPDDYASLAALGIKTIVDLRNDPTDYEKSAAEAVGIKYINVPMSGWKSPKDADVQKVYSILTDPASGKVFVHCKAGIHRTGITGAVYRMEKYGWDYDKAYAEMKNYNFSSGLVHGSLKSYVKDYAKRPRNETAPIAATQTAASGTTH